MLAKAPADSKCPAYLHAFANLGNIHASRSTMYQTSTHLTINKLNVISCVYIHIYIYIYIIAVCVWAYSSEVPAFVLSGVASVH